MFVYFKNCLACKACGYGPIADRPVVVMVNYLSISAGLLLGGQ